MNVSVIIPCINEETQIEAAIESARCAGALEILVADGGSTDQSQSIARQQSAQIVLSKPGRAVQMNAAIQCASGDVLLFLHADCRLPSHAVFQIESAFVDPQRVWGAFRQRIDAPGWIFRAIEAGNSARVRWQKMAYGDQAIFVRRETLKFVGGFDAVPLMEDVMLSQKLSKIARPLLLDGPIEVSSRRWMQRGPIRQTLNNWRLRMLFRLGASPERLANV